ncbi:MAG: hypothetical protein J1F63_04120 [Oscillospiraceae bacterium]|nr:hypothetical protein [Oscillospiraceae bacterium]
MTIQEYALNSLKLRTGIDFILIDEAVSQSDNGDLCRIIYSGGKLAVFCRDEHRKPLLGLLRSVNVKEAIKSPELYVEVLNAIGLDPAEYPFEPAYNAGGKVYKCCHTVEYVCDAKNFRLIPDYRKITVIYPGEPDYLPIDGFSEIYAVYEGGKMASNSYYRPNIGEFSGTNAMNVWTHKSFHRRGYGITAAAAATRSIVNKNELALWVSYADNAASRRIAEALGYEFIGGELRIKE